MTEFDALYEQYATAVYAYALFLCGDRALAQDITSETFVRAWTHAGTIRQDTVKAYLFTIARNLHRDAMRRLRRQWPLDEGHPDERASADRHAEDRSELRFVWGVIHQLPETDRAILLMRARDERSYAEIARELGLSVTAAKVRVHRARLRLLGLMREHHRQVALEREGQ